MTAADSGAVNRLCADLRHLAQFRTDLSREGLTALRDFLNARRRESALALRTGGVAITDGEVPGDLGPAVPIRIYRGGGPHAPAVLFCHSGAFVLGNLDTDHRLCAELAGRAHCTVISVDYRLAPEQPFPAAFDDVLTVLRWVAAHGDNLDVDVRRLAVAGSSAGGALAALLAQCAAAGTAPPLVFQLLHQPVLDDGPTPSKQEFTTTPGFDGPAAHQMWRHLSGAESVPRGAVPARAADLSGVPSALITCSELDPLRDEAIDYARRLMSAGVSTELHVFPGTCHGFDSLLPEWEISQQLFALQGTALRRALHANSRPPRRRGDRVSENDCGAAAVDVMREGLHMDADDLTDIEGLKQLKARYCRLLDGKDWQAWRELFTDDFVSDTSAAGGKVIRGADDFVAFTRSKLEKPSQATAHQVHAPELELTSPTTARGIWALEDVVRLAPGINLRGYGHYLETYQKVDGRWLIGSSTLTRLREDVFNAFVSVYVSDRVRKLSVRLARRLAT